MAIPKAFYSYLENENKLNMLSDEQAGRLYKSLYAFSRTGEKPDLSDDPLLAYAFEDFIIDIERDKEKYEQTCKRRAESGRKGGKANASFASEKQANQANASFASNEQAKTSKSSETEAEAETEAEDNIAHAILSKRARPDFEKEARDVLALFKNKCPSFVQPDKLTDHRRRLIYQARQDNTDFFVLFDKAEKSDFLSGRDGGRGGLGIDWILDPKNRQKVLEGNYDNRILPNKHIGKGSVYDAGSANFDVRKFENTGLFDD